MLTSKGPTVPGCHPPYDLGVGDEVGLSAIGALFVRFIRAGRYSVGLESGAWRGKEAWAFYMGMGAGSLAF